MNANRDQLKPAETSSRPASGAASVGLVARSSPRAAADLAYEVGPHPMGLALLFVLQHH